jgi:hypothetical protein
MEIVFSVYNGNVITHLNYYTYVVAFARARVAKAHIKGREKSKKDLFIPSNIARALFENCNKL